MDSARPGGAKCSPGRGHRDAARYRPAESVGLRAPPNRRDEIVTSTPTEPRSVEADAGADGWTDDRITTTVAATTGARRGVAWGRIGLLLVVAAALAARFVGLDYGLPYSFYPDENKVASATQAIAATGDLRPIHFFYPTFWLYVLALALKLGAIVAPGLGEGTAFGPVDLGNLAYVYWATRVVTAVVAALAVVPLYLLARRLFTTLGLPWPGGLALAPAGFLALSPLHVQHSHVASPDVPTSTFLVIAAYFTLRIVDDGRARWYVLAGVATGLAAGVKYPSALFALAIVVAHLARSGARARPPHLGFALALLDRRLWLAGLVTVGTFVSTSPYVVLDGGRFLANMDYETDKQFARGKEGDLFAEGPLGIALYAPNTMRWGLDTPAAILAALGLGWAIWFVVRSARRAATFPLAARCLMVLLSYPLVLYLFSWTWQIRPPRYLLPLLPFACLLAGLGLALLVGRGLALRSTAARRASVLGLAAFTLGTLLWQADGVVRYDLFLARRDTRVIAAEWMAANLPPGADVLTEWYGPPHPSIRQMGSDLPGQSPEHYRRRGYRYVATSSFMHERWTRNPEGYPRRARFYRSLDERASLLYSIGPWPEYPYDPVQDGWQGWHAIPLDGDVRPGPRIRVYQLAP